MRLPARGGSPRSVVARRAAVVGVLLLGIGLVGTPAEAAPAMDLVVGAPAPGCAAPDYATVAAAVAAARAGATITVCRGVYPGTVVIDKALTLRGAQHGRTARSGRDDRTAESVIDGAGRAGFEIMGTTSGVTIDGFTISGSGSDAVPANGVGASRGGGGFTIANNIISGSTYGLSISAGGAAPSVVTGNRFVDNNRTGVRGGSGIFVCCGPGGALSITDNLFSGHRAAAVNVAGDRDRPSTGLRVEGNRSVDDATFAVIVNARDAVVADNAVVRTPQGTAPVGSGILVGGHDDGLRIVRNTVTGGAAVGIRISDLYGSRDTGLVVSANTVSGRQNGLELAGQTAGSVTGNVIEHSAEVGIVLDADNAGVTVARNTVGSSGTLDCRDGSAGDRTSGTANTWTANVAGGSVPRAICGR